MRNGAGYILKNLSRLRRPRRFQSSRRRSKAEHLCQVCKLGAHHPERSLKRWPPYPRLPQLSIQQYSPYCNTIAPLFRPPPAMGKGRPSLWHKTFCRRVGEKKEERQSVTICFRAGLPKILISRLIRRLVASNSYLSPTSFFTLTTRHSVALR
jgi:hypothetical protein